MTKTDIIEELVRNGRLVKKKRVRGGRPVYVARNFATLDWILDEFGLVGYSIAVLATGELYTVHHYRARYPARIGDWWAYYAPGCFSPGAYSVRTLDPLIEALGGARKTVAAANERALAAALP